MSLRHLPEYYTSWALEKDRKAADKVYLGWLTFLLLGVCLTGVVGGSGVSNFLGGNNSIQEFDVSPEVLDRGVTIERVSGERFAVRGENYEVSFPFTSGVKYVELVDISSGKKVGSRVCRFLGQPGCSTVVTVPAR